MVGAVDSLKDGRPVRKRRRALRRAHGCDGIIAGEGAATLPRAPDSARARAQELAADGIGTCVAR